MKTEVVTRFAPSPTGHLNIGGVRAGIFAYLFARHHSGKFILRIEDTDKARSKKEYEESILESMQWLGLEYDAMYRQSDNKTRHEELLRKLVNEDKAYLSKEEPKEEGGREEVIRFRNPNKKVSFFDEVRGEIEFDTTELKDFIIAKSFDEPVFHFAVVADDMDEGVTYVVRGEDHISNTPRQILIWEALGVSPPRYAHLPLIVGSDRGKLSKRKGAKALIEYREMGYLPEAIVNYDAFLGWHPGSEKEVFTKEELIELFTLERVQSSAAMFNEEKLLWFNKEHIKRLSVDDFKKRLHEFSKKTIPDALVPLIQERAQTFKEAIDLIHEFNFLDSVVYSLELLLQGANGNKEEVAGLLKKTIELLENLSDEAFTPEGVKEVVFPYATEVGRSKVLWPMRVALSGREKSPDPFTLAHLLGKEKTILRLKDAIEMLK